MQEGLLAHHQIEVCGEGETIDVCNTDASDKGCCEADFVEKLPYRSLFDNGDLITSTHHIQTTPATTTPAPGGVTSQLVRRISHTMSSSDTLQHQSCNPVITGQDRNLNLQRADSESSIEFDAVNSVRNSSSSTMEEVPCRREGREAPSDPTSENGAMLPNALLHPCLPTLSPASPPQASEATNENTAHQTTPSEECDPAEIYPHHKKFRLHRKRAAALAAQQSSKVQQKEEITESYKDTNNDSLTPGAKINSEIRNIMDRREGESTSQTEPIKVPPVTLTCAVPSVPLTCDFSDAGNASEHSENYMKRPNTVSLLDASFRTPEMETSSIGDESDDMDTSDRSCDVSFTFEEGHVTSSEMGVNREDAFGSTAEQHQSAVHECGWLQCSRQFTCLEDFVNHVNDAHIRAERDVHYKCYWKNCPRRGKGFNARYKMLIHVRTHTNERPYKCNLCNKSFSRLENLKIHNRSHTGERPYVCPFEGCKKAYSNSSDRFKHVRTHQEQKPYSCRMPGCDKRYTDPSSLRKHIKTHGHYFRGPATEKSSCTSSTISHQDSNNGPGVNNADFSTQISNADVHVPAKSLLSVPTTYLTPGFSVSAHPLLSPTSQLQSSSLTTERLLELQARENLQSKGFLGGQLFSGLSLPRHPLLGLSLPYSLPEAHFTLSQTIPKSSSLLMPLAQNVHETRSYVGSLGSSGSLSPGPLSDSAQSVFTDTESCSSPPLSFGRAGSHETGSPRHGSYSSHSPLLYPPAQSLPEASAKQSAFSSVSPTSSPYSPEQKYSLSNRSQLVSRHARISPSYQPYSRPMSEYVDERERSPVSPAAAFRKISRGDKPLDLSNPPESPMSDRDGSPVCRLSPPVAPYHAFGLPLHCHTPPKCDLGPAFPALRLLNHA